MSKFAGKYETEEALDQGIAAARKTLGLPELPAGTKFGGYADAAGAETYYKSLESLIGKVKPTPTSDKPGGDNAVSIKNAPAAAGLDDDADLAQILESVGLDPKDLAEQWARDGKLSDDAYAKFKSKGLSKVVVNGLIAGQLAAAQLQQQQSQAIRSNAQKLAGGEQQLANLLAFGKSLPPQRIADLDQRLADPAKYEGAIKELLYEHAQAVGAGNAKPLIEGSGGVGDLAGKPASLDEFNKIRSRALRGDQAAAAQILNMDLADMQALV